MKKLLTFAFLITSACVYATPVLISADSIPTNQKDVITLDGIISALYQCVSGPAGEKRNFERMATLFSTNARLISTGRKPDGAVYKNDMSLADYFTMAGPRLEKSGFFEIEISRKEEHYASIANLFSTYESRRATTDEKPFARGINSIQLFNDGKRWWIVNIIWASETTTTMIPEKYLKRP